MSNNEIDKTTAPASAPKTLRMGKTQAREEFLSLVNAVAQGVTAVEITDHDRPVAVLLSYQNYIMMTSKLAMLTPSPSEAKPSLVGSIQILVDDLEAASAEVADVFKTAIKTSAKKLS